MILNKDHRIYFASDHHLNHKSIITFDTPRNNRKRFSTVPDMNEYILDMHNQTVRTKDTIYMLGDVAWNAEGLKLVKKMNGHKVLIMGNHDRQNFKQYEGYFQDLKGVLYLGKRNTSFILSHIPVHPEQLKYRFSHNIHGHLHEYNVLCEDGSLDERYFNVSMEQINYKPIELDEIRQKLGLI